MIRSLLKPSDSLKQQKGLISGQSSTSQLLNENEQQVKSMAEQLLQEFDSMQKQAAPLSQSQLRKVGNRQLHSEHNNLMHRNRLKEKKVGELRSVLSQLVLLNGGVPEETRRSPSSILSRSQQIPLTPEARIALLNSQISETEDKIDSEARETERVEYMLEKTNRAMHDSRTKCQTLQKQCGIILGKYTEIQDLEAKSRYGLQHAKSEAQIFGETLRKDSEKRVEKIGVLKKDKRDIEETTARIVKTLAEQMVKGQATKNVEERHAQELDAIYDKHITSLTSTRRDEESKDNLEKALHTICDLINRSETLALERKVSNVRLSDLIGFTHQFEMKMSSLESQVQSLSMQKHDLEMGCVDIRAELETMRGNEFQTADLMLKIQSRLEHLGIRHPVGTFNQLKTFTESMDKSVNTDEVLKHDAFLASSFMTLNVVTKRVVIMLEYILSNAGPHPGKLRDLMHALSLSQKHGETYVTTASSTELPDIPIWEQDVSTASWFFREAFEEVPEWGLDLDEIIRETCDMLMVRIFAIDSRLKTDLRSWHSAQLSIVDISLHRLFLEKLISLSHSYLRSKLSESFSLMGSLVLTISETTASIEKEVSSTPLTEPQLSQLINFKLMQASGGTGKPLTISEKSVSEILRKAFEKKYKKLMVQQHAFKLEEESAEFVSRFHSKKKTEVLIEPKVEEASEEDKIDEDAYATTLRKTAKSAGRALPLSKSSSQGRLSRIDSPSMPEQDCEAFAQVRSLNVRIRAIKETEKSPSSPQMTQRLLPDIRGGSRASEGKARRGMSERQTGRERKGSTRGQWGGK